MPFTDEDNLELFFGDASAAEAWVYARWPHSMADASANEGLKLTGRVVGPHCRYAKTLLSTVPLVEQGGGPGLLARALLLDPCFWSPREPYLYRAEVALTRGSETRWRVEHPIGIRPLGIRDRRLRWEGKNWLLRAACVDAIGEDELPAWRESALALVVDEPDDRLCRAASEVGVLLLAEVTGTAAELTARLRRLGRWPAVAMAIVDSPDDLPADLGRVAPNLLLIQSISPGDVPRPAPWARIALCDEDDPARLAALNSALGLPIVVRRRMGRAADPVAARAECDRLQRDLAGRFEGVGLIV